MDGCVASTLDQSTKGQLATEYLNVDASNKLQTKATQTKTGLIVLMARCAPIILYLFHFPLQGLV